MIWIALVLVIVIIVAVHCARGMSYGDRISAALDLVDSSDFVVADGFEDARREDPNLVAWMKAEKDCVMLFRSQQGAQIHEVIDIASGNFHPGLVIHYDNGRAVRTDVGDLREPHLRKKADELLRRVQRIGQQVHPPQLHNYDGFHY